MTPYFDDWKRFCFVLREIATGEDGRPLSGVEARKRAQAVLAECGYAWPNADELGTTPRSTGLSQEKIPKAKLPLPLRTDSRRRPRLIAAE